MSQSDPGETDALSGLESFHHLKRHGLHQRQSSSRRHQRCRPTLGCLMITVAFTLLGTAALSASIFTDYWERIDYNVSSIDAIAQRSNGTHRLTWLFNKTVARIVLNPLASSSSAPSSTAGSRLSGRAPSSSNSYLLPKRNVSNATTATPIRPNDGLSLDRPFGAPNYVQFASIDRQQEISKLRWSGFSHPEDGALNKSRILSKRNRRHATSNGTHRRKKRAGSRRRPDSLFYLIPLHGGIWHLCVDLQNDQLRMLQEMGLDRDACTEYLATSGALAASGAENDAFRVTSNYLNHHVQSKMHNLSISCAMVCVILLASAALLGTFGIMKRQISAVLITGVMYILAGLRKYSFIPWVRELLSNAHFKWKINAPELTEMVSNFCSALFAVFSLVIMHCKRNSRRETGFVDDPLVNPVEYNEARIFSNSWSMLLGWAGSAVIFVASIFWLFLAKVMRYNQLTFFF